MAPALRIGMVGCGEIAVQTAKAIAAAPSATHAIVMDVDPRVAADMGATYCVPHTTRVEDVFGEADAVYLAVPHYLHAPIALQAIAAGKHVLVEKPIATTLEDADRMIAAARDRAVVLSVAFLAQGDAQLQRVRDLIRSGAIGEITGTRVVLRADKPETYWSGGFTGRIQTDWRASKQKAGGGVLIMNTVHDLNTLRWLTGLEVTRVYAEYGTFATGVEVEDFVALTYRYENGAIGTLEAGSAVRGRDPLREPDRIYGTDGQVLLSNPPRVFANGDWRDLDPVGGALDPRTAAVEGFARAILDGTDPPVTAEDGRSVLEVIVAAYRSGEEGRPVHLPLVTAAARSRA